MCLFVLQKMLNLDFCIQISVKILNIYYLLSNIFVFSIFQLIFLGGFTALIFIVLVGSQHSHELPAQH